MNGDIDKVHEADHAGETDDSCSEVREAIMEATYRALCTHGAADLTVQAIADEFDKSKSLIFYHYDSKEDLLTSFLAYLLNRFEQRVPATDVDDPAQQLAVLIDALLLGPDDHKSFQTAMLEFRSQAPYNEAYQEQFRTNDTRTRKILARLIEHGMEEGVFQTVDPDRIATVYLVMIEGARTRWIVLNDDEILDTVADDLRQRIEDELLVDSIAESELSV